jgi:hypothetical protein
MKRDIWRGVHVAEVWALTWLPNPYWLSAITGVFLGSNKQTMGNVVGLKESGPKPRRAMCEELLCRDENRRAVFAPTHANVNVNATTPGPDHVSLVHTRCNWRAHRCRAGGANPAGNPRSGAGPAPALAPALAPGLRPRLERASSRSVWRGRGAGMGHRTRKGSYAFLDPTRGRRSFPHSHDVWQIQAKAEGRKFFDM